MSESSKGGRERTGAVDVGEIARGEVPSASLACKEMWTQDQTSGEALARRMSLHATYHNVQLLTCVFTCLLPVFSR